jgi:hypothetical protein
MTLQRDSYSKLDRIRGSGARRRAVTFTFTEPLSFSTHPVAEAGGAQAYSADYICSQEPVDTLGSFT